MITQRTRAVVVGALFIVATAFLFIGGAVYKPVVESPDYLAIAHPQRVTVVTGIFLELICVLAMPLLSIALYPVLRRQSESLALGYVGFRFFEAILFVFMEANYLALIGLSEAYLDGGKVNEAWYNVAGEAIVSVNASAFLLYVIIFCVGALTLYATLYASRLVPRWIAAWGFAGALLMLIGVVMTELGFLPAGSAALEMILILPIAINEMVLAIWLIAKGFDMSTIEARG